MASTTSRDRSRLAVAAVSGVTTIAALSATGWLAGTAASSAAADQSAEQAPPATPKPAVKARQVRTTPKVVLRQRPQRTHVSVRYVQGAPSAPVGSGGAVSQPVSQPVTHTPAAPAPQHSAPAPAPAPPPAPSSGS